MKYYMISEKADRRVYHYIMEHITGGLVVKFTNLDAANNWLKRHN